MANTLELLNLSNGAFWNNRPTAFLVANTAQSIPNTTITPVAFQIANLDNWSGWSSGSNTRYTVQVAGVYSISGFVPWSANTTGTRIGFIMYNGAEVAGSQSENAAVSTTNVNTSVVTPILKSCAVGDSLQLGCYQGSGGSLSTGSNSGLQSSMTVQFVRFP